MAARGPSSLAAGADDQDVINRVKDQAKKAGLGPITQTQTEHFLALGDAPVRWYSDPALRKCEALAQDFLDYFQQREFPVALPRGRLTLVTLKDGASYKAYIGEEPAEYDGGQYARDANQLVIFDYEAGRKDLAGRAGRVNSFTLAHEAAHLLCFNTGLLSPQADVPVCISEGLATYIELWQRPHDRSIGAINRPRLKALMDAGNDEVAWIPIGDLIAEDRWFDDPKTEQLAYAESWLLVHHLLKTRALLPKFRAHLAGIPQLPQGDGAKRRVEYAETHLGSLRVLDRDVRRLAVRLR
jgi:hypothetical protein